MSIKKYFGSNIKSNVIENIDTEDIKDDIKDIEKYTIGNINLYDLWIKKQKINYKLFIKNKESIAPIKIVLSWLKCPFGVEKYFFKEIINLEFTNYKNKNYSYNNFAKISQIDEAFNKLNIDKEHVNNFKHLSNFFLGEIKELNYMPSIKTRPENFDPLFRIHLKKSKNTITTNFFFKKKDGKYEHSSVNDIKDKMLEIEIELSNIWIKNNDYGLIWIANKIIILSN
jgi:hypothetical protein